MIRALRQAIVAAVTTPDLRTADSADEFVDRLERLLLERGPDRHEEAVDHLQHALQSADESARLGGDRFDVAAALLHDIGHLVTGERHGEPGFLERDLRHEEIAARLLARWLPPEVVEPVRLHVAAKRYLCSVEAGYPDLLSATSRRSLELQGGAMTLDEQRRFEACPHAGRAILLRRADDRAKVPDRPTPPLVEFVTELRTIVKAR